ncbi:tetratricopeptide repeat protein [Dokdonella sp.]|uniref:serine/threonine-protein kinase n=1 Tax=Dokdonella sp. TaxID=2291710 RepID=UPI001B08E7F3|nr:tetratricopeptide repeat protein [Dokdonella sp.]MBO9664337.1 tetratricopeptide repeat protein [Dokdonella sp.]
MGTAEVPPTLRELFERAVPLAPAERAAFLAACADANLRERLRRLLDADDRGAGSLGSNVETVADRLGEADCTPVLPAGTRIGPFELLDVLGEGGSSTVFRAARTQGGVRQQVALKLLRRGLYSPDAQRQFRRERLALAQLQHPGIARLIEGGVTESGLAYIALDLVDGMPITDYARARRLDLRARLGLFLQVCRAVEAAHRALIVHRDLKPSNVLVTAAGEVKLLDFGIAKLLEGDDETQTRLPAFTPAYAAPEQKRGDLVTTATDVYALGVLLGELVTGERLGDGRTPSGQVGDRNEPGALPATPPVTRRLLRGDLDTIVLKALDEDPARRYASAGAFADDVERLQGGRPVLAHPPSRWYRTRKFVARHKGGVATTFAFLLAVLAALGVATWQAHVARQEALRANTVRDFVLGVFGAARARLPREQRPTPEQLVDEAQRRLAAASLDAPTRAQVLLTLGEVNLSLSDHARAEAQLAQAATLASQGGDDAGARRARLLRASALQRSGRNREALQAAQAEMATLRAQPSRERLLALDVAASAEMALGAATEALAHRSEAVAAAANLPDAEREDALLAELELGNALTEAQRYPAAIARLEASLARWREAGLQEDSRYVAALGNLAVATDGIGETARSEARLRELLALKQRIYSAPHDSIATTLRDLAQIVGRDVARSAEADDLLEQALAMQRTVFGDDHEEIAKTYDARGEVLIAQRRLGEAEASYREALAVCARAAIKSEVCPRARNNLGMALYRQERLDEAEAEMRRALAERRTLFGEDHPTVAYSLSTLSAVAMKRKDAAQGVELAAQALRAIERSGHDGSREAVLIRNTYAAALWRADRNAEALPEIERTLQDWQRVAPEAKSRRVAMLVQKAQILDELGRKEDARRSAEEGIALGVAGEVLQPLTKQLLRKLSGRDDVYPEVAAAAAK